ncbi:L,D-transpeptidase family protein [Rahnella sp. PD12R]|uniref:L,D-transpeptidase family protein n=1 Tax=Rahnella sp. PD12R TaxID=2855688 RepID=UPI001C43767A|nr:L,D-transpeptidase family protein [Rahnella sp. PD12R]MBV6820207.1 L,D-transpeptidase family protein [Rahnella sp. PD12R]
MRRALPLLAMLVGTFLTTHSMTAGAAEYPLPPDNSRLIGENTTYVVPNDGKPLEDVAAKYQIGLIAMLEANPGTDPYLPKAGTVLTIPSQMLLPDSKREGIVVNLAELRLYYYPKGEDKVIVYPIGIGQLGRNTPEMVTSVSQKIPNPTWTPTANIRKAYLKDGITLPGMVPAGPDNPMGLFAMRLSAGTGQYLIHGTNANFGIGMRVSSGCIRLRPDDIEALFNSVPKGTRVQIVNQPIKFDVEPDGKRYIEVHQPLSHTEKDDPQTKPILLTAAMKKFIKSDDTNAEIVKEAIRRRSGMPVVVSVGDKATDMPPAANAPQTVSADTPAVTTASTQ